MHTARAPNRNYKLPLVLLQIVRRHIPHQLVNLVNENIAVYDFCGKKFDTEDFRKKTRIIAEDTIALIFDNASFYYSEIKSLINNFPKEKNS